MDTKNKNRRSFIKKSIALTPLLLTGVGVPFAFGNENHKNFEAEKITKIELYRYDVTLSRHFSFGVWKNRQVVFLKITCGKYYGWGEINAGVNKPDLDIKQWGQFLLKLKGKTIDEAFQFVESKYGATGWRWNYCELIEMALYDIWGKMENKPAVELLGLKGNKPVAGLFPILEEDIEKAKTAARLAIKRKYTSHIKLKIFGKKESDGKLIEAVREIMGEATYIVCDPNEGYKDWDNLKELSDTLKYLGSKGMNGCEDPAKLTIRQWMELQKMVDPISIIPDAILRPSWEALKKSKQGMGHVYNLHPATMGSFKYMIQLAEKIKGWGHQLMIGDASLVGLGCSVWQQLAIGMGADWVEAIEKPIESDNYLPCVESQATYRTSEGKIAMDPKPGFGIELNEKKLEETCSIKVSI